jgi:hypothetical protein
VRQHITLTAGSVGAVSADETTELVFGIGLLICTEN